MIKELNPSSPEENERLKVAESTGDSESTSEKGNTIRSRSLGIEFTGLEIHIRMGRVRLRTALLLWRRLDSRKWSNSKGAREQALQAQLRQEKLEKAIHFVRKGPLLYISRHLTICLFRQVPRKGVRNQRRGTARAKTEGRQAKVGAGAETTLFLLLAI